MPRGRRGVRGNQVARLRSTPSLHLAWKTAARWRPNRTEGRQNSFRMGLHARARIRISVGRARVFGRLSLRSENETEREQHFVLASGDIKDYGL